MKLLVGIWCLIISPVVFGFLNEESVKEQKCVVDLPLANVNFTWVTSVPLWYLPHASKLELYRSAADVNHSPVSEIQEHELYYDLCYTYKFEGEGATVYGFHGKTENYTISANSTNVFNFQAATTKVGGTYSVALTDNATYTFFVTCWDDGQASWSVGSTTKTLDDETVQKIWNHAKSLGFSDKHFTHLRYETC